jgi:hypothetical protein
MISRQLDLRINKSHYCMMHAILISQDTIFVVQHTGRSFIIGVGNDTTPFEYYRLMGVHDL